VKQPLDRWAELERTYRYAQRYAPEVFDLPYSKAKLAPVIHPGPGRGKKTVGNTNGFSGLNNAAYIRARLERDAADADHPDRQEVAARLLPRVVAGEISAHAAAVEAGWRHRLVQVAPTVEGFVRAIKKHLSAEERRALKEEILACDT
jgi:hypothetical protein